MSASRERYSGLVCGALTIAIVAAPGCSVRIGSEGTPAPGIPSACSRVGSERKLTIGAGSGSFSFVWDADHYVIAYSNPATGHGDIYVAKIAADGSLIGSPEVVDATPSISDLPNLLKTPGGYWVVWQEGSAGKAVFAHALGPDAAPVGSGIDVAATQASQSRPVLALTPGGQVAVAFMDSLDGKGGVEVALVDPVSSAVTGPERVAASDNDGWPWIAGDDQALAMVWSDAQSTVYDVRFALLDPRSLSLGPAFSLRGSAPHSGLLPRLIRTSFGFMSAWEDQGSNGGDNSIYMSLVDAAGHRMGAGMVEEPGSGDANWPNMAQAGPAVGVVYYQFRAGRPQIFMSFIDDTGRRVRGLPDLQVSSGTAGWSKYPDVLFTGSEFGVVYVDTRDGGPALWFQRVSCQSG